MKRIIVLIAVLVMVPVMAQAKGYMGLGFGMAKWDSEIEAGTAELDDTDTSIRFFGGANLSDNFALELGFADLGEAKLTGDRWDTFTMNDTPYYFMYPGSISIDASTVSLAGIVKFPAKKVVPFVGVGLHKWDADMTISFGGMSESVSDDGTDIMLLTGVEFPLSNNFSIRADYTYYKMDDEDELLNFIGVLSGSAVIRF